MVTICLVRQWIRQGQEVAFVEDSLEQIWLNLEVGVLLGSYLFDDSGGRRVTVNELLELTHYDSQCIYPQNTPVVYNGEIYFSIRAMPSGVLPETFISNDTLYRNMRLEDIEEDIKSKVLIYPWRQFAPDILSCHCPSINSKKIIEIVINQSIQEQELTTSHEVSRPTI